jgi:hypothetical protein
MVNEVDHGGSRLANHRSACHLEQHVIALFAMGDRLRQSIGRRLGDAR